MSRPTIDHFAATPDGTRFFECYDALVDSSSATPLDVETPFGMTRVNTYGPPGAPPVVLLPGGGATSLSWMNAVGPLAMTRRVHAVDLVGDVGRSRVARPPRSTGELIDWLSSVLGGLGVSRVDLAGHSYGAMIALAYAIDAPERVGRLALVDPTSCFTPLRPYYLLHALPTLLAPSPRRQRRFLEWETRAAALNPMWCEMYCAGARFPTSPTVVPKRPTREALSVLEDGRSVTVTLARDSRAHDATAVARRVHETLPSARVHILGRASHHSLPLEPAHEIADALVDAFEETRT